VLANDHGSAFALLQIPWEEQYPVSIHIRPHIEDNLKSLPFRFLVDFSYPRIEGKTRRREPPNNFIPKDTPVAASGFIPPLWRARIQISHEIGSAKL
jgi:hypothetical protein